MPRTAAGARVGAIRNADDNHVFLFGYGTYVGDEIPHEKVGGMGELLREAGIANPKIALDSGKDVFGCECWWASEARCKEMIGNRAVVMIDIDEAREEARREAEAQTAGHGDGGKAAEPPQG